MAKNDRCAKSTVLLWSRESRREGVEMRMSGLSFNRTLICELYCSDSADVTQYVREDAPLQIRPASSDVDSLHHLIRILQQRL
jgi:hypothetical protein